MNSTSIIISGSARKCASTLQFCFGNGRASWTVPFACQPPVVNPGVESQADVAGERRASVVIYRIGNQQAATSLPCTTKRNRRFTLARNLRSSIPRRMHLSDVCNSLHAALKMVRRAGINGQECLNAATSSLRQRVKDVDAGTACRQSGTTRFAPSMRLSNQPSRRSLLPRTSQSHKLRNGYFYP